MLTINQCQNRVQRKSIFKHLMNIKKNSVQSIRFDKSVYLRPIQRLDLIELNWIDSNSITKVNTTIMYNIHRYVYQIRIHIYGCVFALNYNDVECATNKLIHVLDIKLPHSNFRITCLIGWFGEKRDHFSIALVRNFVSKSDELLICWLQFAMCRSMYSNVYSDFTEIDDIFIDRHWYIYDRMEIKMRKKIGELERDRAECYIHRLNCKL